MSAKQRARPRLTAQQQLFVEVLTSDPAMTQTEAARQAGYKGTALREAGRALMAKPHVRAAVEAVRRRRRQKFQVEGDRVLRELVALAFSDLGEILDFSGDAVTPGFRRVQDIPATARRAIQAIKVHRQTGDVLEFKLHDKGAALDKLMRHLGLYTDTQFSLDLKALDAGQLERIANGEHPLRVLAAPRAG